MLPPVAGGGVGVGVGVLAGGVEVGVVPGLVGFPGLEPEQVNGRGPGIV